MPLRSQTQSFQTLQQQESGERVQRRTQVTQDHDTEFDSEGDVAERLAEHESVVALCGFCERREST